MPERIVSLIYQVKKERQNDLIRFLARAIPFYESPGNIKVLLYEYLDQPGKYLELVEYSTVDSYEADQQRVESSYEYRVVLDEWRRLIEGELDVGRLRRIDPCSSVSAGITLAEPVMPAGLVLETAAFNDSMAIKRILTDNGLPVPDRDDRPVWFLSARRNGKVIGCVGWEAYGFRVLLRSLAVRQDQQRQGIGSLLLQTALSRLSAGGASEFYLLTVNAVDFAARFGFRTVDRDSLPEGVDFSRQLLSGCCSTAQCMRLLLS